MFLAFYNQRRTQRRNKSFRGFAQNKCIIDERNGFYAFEPHQFWQGRASHSVMTDADNQKVAALRSKLQQSQMPGVNYIKIPRHEDYFLRVFSNLSNRL